MEGEVEAGEGEVERGGGEAGEGAYGSSPIEAMFFHPGLEELPLAKKLSHFFVAVLRVG